MPPIASPAAITPSECHESRAAADACARPLVQHHDRAAAERRPAAARDDGRRRARTPDAVDRAAGPARRPRGRRVSTRRSTARPVARGDPRAVAARRGSDGRSRCPRREHCRCRWNPTDLAALIREVVASLQPEAARDVGHPDRGNAGGRGAAGSRPRADSRSPHEPVVQRRPALEARRHRHGHDERDGPARGCRSDGYRRRDDPRGGAARMFDRFYKVRRRVVRGSD